MLDIINHLCDYYPGLSFIWVGDGDMRNDIVQYIKEKRISEHVHLLGTQEHVAKILACCEYFLCPSQREGFGIVFIEAQAVVLKCFASDQVPNVVDCGGVSFIELEKSAEEWAAEIHRQIEKYPHTKIDGKLIGRYDINETVKALSDVYERLAES